MKIFWGEKYKVLINHSVFLDKYLKIVPCCKSCCTYAKLMQFIDKCQNQMYVQCYSRCFRNHEKPHLTVFVYFYIILIYGTCISCIRNIELVNPIILQDVDSKERLIYCYTSYNLTIIKSGIFNIAHDHRFLHQLDIWYACQALMFSFGILGK